jgi:putative membrane protein
MHRRFLCTVLLLACASWTAAQNPPPGQDKDQPLTDAQFVLKASGAGMAEVDMGNLGVKQATNTEVKKFAQKMVEDHTKANRELMDLAGRKNLKATDEMPAEHQKMRERLAQMKGEEFDREYMGMMVKDHVEAVALFEKQSRSGQDEDLKKWAAQTLPTLRDHLRMAQEINRKVGGKDPGQKPDHP